MKKNFVIISTYFPPQIHTASNRAAAFAKYIDRSKYDVTIITKPWAGRDVRSESQKYNARIIEIALPERFGLFHFSEKDSWLAHKLKALCNKVLINLISNLDARFTKAAVEIGRDLIQAGKLDLVLTTCWPVGPLLAGLELKRKFPQVFWISDMRDELSKNPFLPKFLRLRLQSIETEMVRTADLLLSVSKPILDDFQAIAGRGGQQPNQQESNGQFI